MQSERRSSIHCIDHPKTWKTLPGCEEYNQTANLISKGSFTFEWPRGEEEEEEEGAEDRSPCPSLLASIDLSRTTSEAPVVNNPERLTTTKKGGDGGAMTLSEILNAAAAAAAATIPQHKIDDPWLMQHLREAKARWSGSEPRYLDEVYGRVGARNLLWFSQAVDGEPSSSPPRRDSQQSDMSGGSHPASIFKHALHNVKDGGSPDDSFELHLHNTTELLGRNDDADSDVSELDLTEVSFR